MPLFLQEKLAIARRAQDAIGTRYRLHGRSITTGLDCAGLVAHAIKPHIKDMDIPQHYALRFDDIAIPISFFANSVFVKIDESLRYQIGDIILIAPASSQLHLIIITGDCFVHAHSGLRRIVETNLPILSPVKAVWRYKGE